MWVSKKEMDKIWKHIEQLEHTVNQLEAVHTIVDDADFPFAPSFRCISHMPWATTKTAGAISFQELAETLVDGKPLMRKKTTEEEVKFKCPLGSASVTLEEAEQFYKTASTICRKGDN